MIWVRAREVRSAVLILDPEIVEDLAFPTLRCLFDLGSWDVAIGIDAWHCYGRSADAASGSTFLPVFSKARSGRLRWDPLPLGAGGAGEAGSPARTITGQEASHAR